MTLRWTRDVPSVAGRYRRRLSYGIRTTGVEAFDVEVLEDGVAYRVIPNTQGHERIGGEYDYLGPIPPPEEPDDATT